jgi:hypothetical protein
MSLANEIESFTVEGLKVTIVYDDRADGPRTEGDMLSVMVCDHRRYSLGDRHPNEREENILSKWGWHGLKRYLHLTGAIATTKLGLYDHSGITMYAVGDDSNGHGIGDEAGWDSGIVGFAYVTRERWNELCGEQFDPLELVDDEEQIGFGKFPVKRTRVEKQMLGEIEEYDSFLRGEVYGYIIERDHPCDRGLEHLDLEESCFGFIGDIEYVKAEATDVAKSIAAEAKAVPVGTIADQIGGTTVQ